MNINPQGVLNLIPLAATISHDALMTINSGVVSQLTEGWGNNHIKILP